jgi:transcriptional regulator with XRE-family HTH domain
MFSSTAINDCKIQAWCQAFFQLFLKLPVFQAYPRNHYVSSKYILMYGIITSPEGVQYHYLIDKCKMMANIREIFVKNLKENRKKCGLSQEKLAEKAEVSTHHIAMIELSRNFPTIDLIERLAGVLGIEVHRLFVDPDSVEGDPSCKRQALMIDIRQAVEKAVENAFSKRDKQL